MKSRPRIRRLVVWSITSALLLFGWGATSCGQNTSRDSTADMPETLFLDVAIGPLLRFDLQPLRASSCASSACHGGARPGLADQHAARGAEYPLWLENDPHSRSKMTLCGKKSVEIMSALGIFKDGQIVDQAAYDNCLACHNSTSEWRHLAEHDVAPQSNDELARAELQQEGVGCAACHGPAEAWIDTHYRAAECGYDLSDGYQHLADLLVRARVCASCHIGDSHRDMNHDMIAAGHPSLLYEFATYHDRLPKHWRDDEAIDPATYQAHLWLAGQIAGLDASLTLLETRAAEATTVSVWPELSEYECASCHHDQSLIEKPTSRDRRPSNALAAYSAWNRTGIRLWLEGQEMVAGGTEAGQRLLDDLEQVESLMESSYRPAPEKVRSAARKARESLNRWLLAEGHSDLATISTSRLNQILAQQAATPWISGSWDSAVQFFLAVAAGRASWPGGSDGATWKMAESVRRILRYPQGRDINTVPLGIQPQERIKQSELENMLQNLGLSLATDGSVELE